MKVSVLSTIVIALATASALPVLQQENTEVSNYDNEAPSWLESVKETVTSLLGQPAEEEPTEVEDPNKYWKHYGKQQRKYWKHYGKQQRKYWAPKDPEAEELEIVEFDEEAVAPQDPYWKHFGKEQKKYWKHYDPEAEELEVAEFDEEVAAPQDPYWKHFGKEQKKYWKHYGKDQKKKWTPPAAGDEDLESFEVESDDEAVAPQDPYWKHYGKEQKKYWKHFGKDQKKKWTPPAAGDDE
ncbi:hypothetical protein CANARDRAFT_22134 [[Candida] arabinofermentans NRRL YB-2248]|uniref:WW domain-containing protein n=1 Tax=[Candida] arabinofermentans NRRL YB-2248 TaxID=983967 RepID=A0A1E4T397_9ASCO|nr:hypothetical protein CANARDRAFT_22134 [[Candida] arabinofermentans NRRL YB-2248]